MLSAEGGLAQITDDGSASFCGSTALCHTVKEIEKKCNILFF